VVYGNDLAPLLDQVDSAERGLRGAAGRDVTAGGDTQADLQVYFDAIVAADQKVEPRDWMPEATARR
jgi:ring-1,2-phenylacetyl-CoA epoxidase subunit PaaA